MTNKNVASSSLIKKTSVIEKNTEKNKTKYEKTICILRNGSDFYRQVVQAKK